MSDLFQGQTMTEVYKVVTDSSASQHTFTFNFQPDKVVFNNLTAWKSTAAGLPISVWFRDQTTAGHAYQQQVIDSNAASSFNFVDAATLGFTPANTAGGQSTSNCSITGISQTDPCVVTHAAFTFQTNQIVRFTDLGDVGVIDHGMSQLNNNRYKVVVIDATHVSLKDVITGEPIDATTFTAYVSGGRMCLETHVISLNNPQVDPYSNLNPYDPNPYSYDPVTYRLTVDTAVLKNSSTYLIEVYKFGQVIDLGIIA